MTQPVSPPPNASAPSSNGAAPASPDAPAPSAAPADASPPTSVDLDAVNSWIESARKRRDQEVAQAKDVGEVAAIREKHAKLEAELGKYQGWASRFQKNPIQQMRALGWNDAQIAEVFKNAQLEAGPQNELGGKLQTALERAEAAEKRAAEVERKFEETRQKDISWAQQQIQVQETRELFARADQAKHPAMMAFYADRPDVAYKAAKEFVQAWTEQNKKDTCPWPVVHEYLDKLARREAGQLVEKMAPILGWSKPQDTTPPPQAKKPAAAGQAGKKAQAGEPPTTATPSGEVPFELLPKEEQRKRAAAAIAAAREARGAKKKA